MIFAAKFLNDHHESKRAEEIVQAAVDRRNSGSHEATYGELDDLLAEMKRVRRKGPEPMAEGVQRVMAARQRPSARVIQGLMVNGRLAEAKKTYRQWLQDDLWHARSMYGVDSESPTLAEALDLGGRLGDAENLALLCLRYKGGWLDVEIEKLAAQASFARSERGIELNREMTLLRSGERWLYGESAKRSQVRLPLSQLPDVAATIKNAKEGGNDDANPFLLDFYERILREKVNTLSDPNVIASPNRPTWAHSAWDRLLNLELTDLQRVIPADSVVANVFRYVSEDDHTCYGAVLVRRNEAPVMITIAESSVLDAAVEQCDASIDGLKTTESFFSECMERLYTLVAFPFEEVLKPNERLLLCPHGSLHFVNPATLLQKDGRQSRFPYQP